MNLLQSLVASHSVSSIKNSLSPYRFSKGASIPQFNNGHSTRLAHLPPVENALALEESQQLLEFEGTEPHRPAVDCGPLFEQGAKVNALVASAREESQPDAPKKTKPKGPARAWFHWPQKTRMRPGLHQAELSFDDVKVVRNDLSDSDLEIVSKPNVVPETVQKSKGPARSIDQRQRPGSNWLVSRLFGWGLARHNGT